MYSNPGEFNCETCIHRYCGDGVPGSNGDAPYPKWVMKGLGWEFKSCLLPMITEQSDFFIRMHKHYCKGILLRQGELLDQPNKYLDAMEILG